MELGQKIKELRLKNSYTQKQLADVLHVSFQTVSKWEKGENEPDVATIKQLAALFNVSVDDLVSEKELPTTQEETKEEIIKVPEVKESTKSEYTCARCGKPIPFGEHRTKRVRSSLKTNGGDYDFYDTYYHKECLEKVNNEKEAKIRRFKAEENKKAIRKVFGWSIAGGILALAISLVVCLVVFKEELLPIYSVLISIAAGSLIFIDLYCILCGSYISDVFLEVASWSIKFPGVIFSFDLDGLMFLIAVKILFAIIGFLVGVAAFLLALVLTVFLSLVSFPFILIHNIKTDYEDAVLC